jgi:predicted nucleotide-binding protein
MSDGHAEELLKIADAAADTRVQIQNDDIQKPSKAVQEVCEEVKRAWSGSNLGYHALVYYAGLRPPPPGVEFSPEWGLMNRWPTHEANAGWQTMDYQLVLNEIFRRAGYSNKDSVTIKLAPLRRTFLELQESAKSVLNIVLADTDDRFLRQKLNDIEALIAPDSSAIEPTLISKGAGWSRDALAATQGARLAPHQSAIAFHLSGAVLSRGIDRLEQLTREAASHLHRLERRNARASLVGTNIFVGHGRSPLWRELKDFIEDRLALPVDEFNSVPVAGIPTTTRLSELLDAAAFAFLVMTGEDEQLDGKIRARENVVHEAGLFQGRLGFDRAIVLLEEECEEFSNIHGLGQIRFPKGNISAKFDDIRAVLEREGLIAALLCLLLLHDAVPFF